MTDHKLTDEQIRDLVNSIGMQFTVPDLRIARAVEAPLLAKVAELEQTVHNLNWALGTDGYPTMATPEQQAEADKAHAEAMARIEAMKKRRDRVEGLEAALAEASKDAQPIPDHELVTMYDERPTCDADMVEFAREVERRHGIGTHRQHITDGSTCWCNPDVDYADPETGASVIVHRRPQ